MTEKQKKIIELSECGLNAVEISKQISSDYSYILDVRKKHGFVSEPQRNSEEHVADYVEKSQPNFEYVSGYITHDYPVLLRCKKCGNVEEHAMSSVRRSGGHLRCSFCFEEEKEKKRAERELKAFEEKVTREQAKKEKELEKAKEEEAKNIKICPVCGKTFTVTSKNRQKVYCSKECNKVVTPQTNNKDKRFAKRGLKKNKKINARALYKRDGGVCWICGGKCNLKDYEVRPNGVIVCGESYPSVDHVKPVSEGGEDTWENVRLAHRWCNSKRYYSPQLYSVENNLPWQAGVGDDSAEKCHHAQ